MLKQFLYCCPDTQQYSQDSGIYDNTFVSTWVSTDASRNSTKDDASKNYQLPLLKLAHKLHQHESSINTLTYSFDSKKKECCITSNNSNNSCYHVLTNMDNYCTHGLLYKSWTELCQWVMERNISNTIITHNVHRYQRHTVDRVVVVTNKNCSTCFMKKSWNDNMKEKNVNPTPCLSSPFVPAKKHKPTSEKCPINFYYWNLV